MTAGAPITPRSRVREAAIGTALVLASLLIAFAGAEIGFRLIASSGKLLEWRNYVAERGTWEGRWRVMQPDEGLGYAPRAGFSGANHGLGSHVTFDADGLRVHRQGQPPPARTMPPILVVGDSYAMGDQVLDDETWPAHVEAGLDRRVLNGGVSGYGLDQIVLRAERLVPAFRPDLTILSFIADDVRRAEARILWGLEKPYFDIVDGALVLRNVPVRPPASGADAQPLDPVRRVLGYSLMADIVMRRLGLHAYWRRGQTSHIVPAHDRGEQVACLMMARLRRLGEVHGTRILVVAQYSPQTWLEEPFRREEVRVVANLLACARAQGLDTFDTFGAVEAAIRTHGFGHAYSGTHLTAAGNRLTADAVLRHLKGGG